MKDKKQKPRQLRAQRRLELLSRISAVDNSDVDGSYTGTPKDGGKPVQDADDI